MAGTHRRTGLASLLILVACVADQASGPRVQGAEPLKQWGFSLSGGGAACGTYNNSPNDVYADWPCSAQIQVLTGGTGNVAALTHATAEWNGAFPAVGMPEFVASSQAQSIGVTGSTGASVNGVWSGTRGGNVSVNLATASGSGSGVPNSIVLHELGHIMGLGNSWDGGAYRTTNVSNHCTSSFTDPGQIYLNTSLCQHLVEYYLYAYGARATAPSWSKHIVTGIDNSPGSLSLYAGANSQVDGTVLALSRAHPSLCGSGGLCIVSTPASMITWHSSNLSVATVTTSNNVGTVTAVAPGTAKIYLTISSGTYEPSSYLPDVDVTVTPAPAIAQIAAGNNVSAPVGTAVNPKPKVRVLASDGTTPIQGVAVTFGSPSGGSTLSQPNQVTDASGYATVGSWTLGATSGGYSMTATIGASGVSPNPLTFNATATPPQTQINVGAVTGGIGGGVVTSTTPAALGINCTLAGASSSGTCSGNVNTGTAVTLSVAANLGYKLSAWGGGCSGSATTCSPSTAGSSVSVTAAFVVKPLANLTRIECEPNGSQRRQQLAWGTTGYPAGTTVTVITNTTNNTGTATTIGSAVALSQGAGWWTPFLSNSANRYFWVKANVSGSSSTWAAYPVIQSSGPCPLF